MHTIGFLKNIDANIATMSGGGSAVGSSLHAGSLTASTVAQAITESIAIKEIVLQADEENSTFVYIGNSTLQPIKLSPGQSITIALSDAALLYAKADAGTAQLNWLARGDA